ncbi:MAG: glycosyltransferase [Oxalobacteraceae bacterium]|nr:glycosyltransferase [Oxalobacteraceae bacterium]
MIKKKTVLVTLTYGDRIGYLKELLTRSFVQEEINSAIVVSNGSTSPLQNLMDEWPGKITLVLLPANTGSANGYAVGIKAALQTQAEYIWLMDDDNAPKKGAVSILHAELERVQTMSYPTQSAVIGFRPEHQVDIAQGVSPWMAIQPRSSFFGFHIARIPYKIWRRLPFGKPNSKNMKKVISLPFSAYGGLLAHRKLFEEIGLPNTDFILYADDSEYTSRITERGGRIALTTDAILDDLESSWNIKTHFSSSFDTWLLGESDRRLYYAVRNHAYFEKNYSSNHGGWRRINRMVYLFLLKLRAKRLSRQCRLELFLLALNDGESGRLGLHENYPLP